MDFQKRSLASLVFAHQFEVIAFRCSKLNSLLGKSLSRNDLFIEVKTNDVPGSDATKKMDFSTRNTLRSHISDGFQIYGSEKLETAERKER
jgi:hypothetical protein